MSAASASLASLLLLAAACCCMLLLAVARCCFLLFAAACGDAGVVDVMMYREGSRVPVLCMCVCVCALCDAGGPVVPGKGGQWEER